MNLSRPSLVGLISVTNNLTLAPRPAPLRGIRIRNQQLQRHSMHAAARAVILLMVIRIAIAKFQTW